MKSQEHVGDVKSKFCLALNGHKDPFFTSLYWYFILNHSFSIPISWLHTLGHCMVPTLHGIPNIKLSITANVYTIGLMTCNLYYILIDIMLCFIFWYTVKRSKHFLCIKPIFFDTYWVTWHSRDFRRLGMLAVVVFLACFLSCCSFDVVTGWHGRWCRSLCQCGRAAKGTRRIQDLCDGHTWAVVRWSSQADWRLTHWWGKMPPPVVIVTCVTMATIVPHNGIHPCHCLKLAGVHHHCCYIGSISTVDCWMQFQCYCIKARCSHSITACWPQVIPW